MTNQTPESVIAEALRYMVPSGDATMKRESRAHNIAAALRAANMLREHGEPDAATEETFAEKMERKHGALAYLRGLLADAVAERDAALAAIERVAVEIKSVAGGITSSSEAAGYRNGLLRAARIVSAALDEAPEPEEKP